MLLSSLPVRGAWVEIRENIANLLTSTSLPVRGAWVEIPMTFIKNWMAASLPVRGAWVEISDGGGMVSPDVPSLPVRGAWVEICDCFQTVNLLQRRSPCGERGLK